MGNRDSIDSVSSNPRVQGYLDRPIADMVYTVVDSRSGSLYCQVCDDIVWDPTLEELRVRKIGSGSFSGKAKSQRLHGGFAGADMSGFRTQEKARRAFYRLNQGRPEIYFLQHHDVVMPSQRNPRHIQCRGDMLSECRSPKLSPQSTASQFLPE